MRKIILFFLFILLSIPGFTQRKDPKLFPALYYGIGWGANNYHKFFSAYFKASLVYSPKHLSIAYYYNNCTVMASMDAEKAVVDNSFMAGYQVTKEGVTRSSLMVSTGISIIECRIFKLMESSSGTWLYPLQDFDRVLGVPLDAQLDLGSSSIIGWGISLHGNLSRYSYFCMGINIRVLNVTPRR